MLFCPLVGSLSQFKLVHQQAEKALDSGHQEAHEVTPRLLRGELTYNIYLVHTALHIVLQYIILSLVFSCP